MADTETISVLQRKAGARRATAEISPLTVTGALGNALRRAGQDIASIAVSVGAAAEGTAVLESILGELPEQALLCMVEGPDSSFGMAILDNQLTAGLVEAMTVGKLSANASANREPTRTDAAICADYLDRTLECFETEASDAGLSMAARVSGYRYALPFMDPQVISLTLENVVYRTFRVELGLDGDARRGVLTLILPLEPPAKSKQAASGGDGAEVQTVADVALTCQAELRAILHEVQLPVTDVAGLEVGMVLPVPLQALGQVSLMDTDGAEVTTCRLGQVRGQRALRIGPAMAFETAAVPNRDLTGLTAITSAAPQNTDPLQGNVLAQPDTDPAATADQVDIPVV
ncbi:FliM/FliN family flagellar motor switch protein [Aliiroseovarius sp. F20344]|uniref:FliM/FliN family flagellar motor switch protein n=1 Tax=Aliiroseovarius sp. F20344 TaxID=2926414 RepID=UPI001FF3395A|nr:FliM/FliN family flagellar motor switch protein [Aliiroseovarius sp. F20344]MCK0143137.1 FliM/FliN family flagellar motor switch protein [Aliiroseovarius sp. F20344]